MGDCEGMRESEFVWERKREWSRGNVKIRREGEWVTEHSDFPCQLYLLFSVLPDVSLILHSLSQSHTFFPISQSRFCSRNSDISRWVQHCPSVTSPSSILCHWLYPSQCQSSFPSKPSSPSTLCHRLFPLTCSIYNDVKSTPSCCPSVTLLTRPCVTECISINVNQALSHWPSITISSCALCHWM